MINNIRNSNGHAIPAGDLDHAPIVTEDQEVDIVDLVAQRVVDKLEEQRHIDALLDRVIERVRYWQADGD